MNRVTPLCLVAEFLASGVRPWLCILNVCRPATGTRRSEPAAFEYRLTSVVKVELEEATRSSGRDCTAPRSRAQRVRKLGMAGSVRGREGEGRYTCAVRMVRRCRQHVTPMRLVCRNVDSGRCLARRRYTREAHRGGLVWLGALQQQKLKTRHDAPSGRWWSRKGFPPRRCVIVGIVGRAGTERRCRRCTARPTGSPTAHTALHCPRESCDPTDAPSPRSRNWVGYFSDAF
jgi:hypothetical protein